MFSIIGNGKWGIAIANYLAKNFEVELLGRRHKSTVSPHIKQVTDWCPQHKVIIYAAPTKLAPMLFNQISWTPEQKTCLILSKGLICDADQPVTTLYEYCCQRFHRVAVMQGPSFAEELAQVHPTAMVCASEHQTLHDEIAQWFNHAPLILQHGYDPVGVSLAGAFKNPVAILMGYLDAAQPSANFRHAFLTYSNQVLSAMIQSMGGSPHTAYGYAGQGDLLMTATTDLSRNRRFGQLLYRGYSAEEAKQLIGETVEGLDGLALLNQFCVARGCHVELLALIEAMTNGDIKANAMVACLVDLMKVQRINLKHENAVV